MKKLLIAFLVVTLVFTLIPYDVDAHTSCNAKLIAREKELITAIQNLEAQKITVEPLLWRAFAEYLIVRNACENTGIGCGILSVFYDDYMKYQAEMDAIDAKLEQAKAELVIVQAKLKRSCKRR